MRIRSVGIDYELTHCFDCFGYYGKEENYFKYFLEEIFDIDNLKFFRQDGRGGCLHNPNQVKNLSGKLDDDIVHNLFLICHAGGMNNNMYFAERISDDICFGDAGHKIVSYAMYLWSRCAPISYDLNACGKGDDPFDIIESFQKKGRLDFKKGVIKDAVVSVPFFLAGQHIRFLIRFLQKNLLSCTVLEFQMFSVYNYKRYVVQGC